MSKIIMIGNQKGGVGKTAVSIMTATALSQAPFNLKTCIIDLDNQKSVIRSRKYDLRAYQTEEIPFDVFDFTISELQKNIAQLDKEYQIIFIDVAGKLDNTQPIEVQEISKALLYVDCLFIPFVAGNYNLESTIDYFKFIKTVQQQRAIQPRPLKVFGFVNMYRGRSRANTSLGEDLVVLNQTEKLTLLNTALNDYALFREADTITSIYDASSSETAKVNFSNFVNEFLTVISK